ncbi:MAG: tetratricopeptide repeat protein, partial [Polyangiales bacterium]
LLARQPKPALATLERATRSLHARVRPPAFTARRLVLLGRVLMARNKRGDLDAARAALREAVQQPAAAADTFFYLGEALRGQDAAEARAAYQRYLELAPRGPLRAHALRALSPADTRL